MKTKIEKLRYRYFITLILFAFSCSSNMYGQNSVNSINSIKSIDKINKVSTNQYESNGQELIVTQKVNIDFRPNVSIKFYDVDTKILPSTGNTIKVSFKYIAESKNEEDLKKLHDAIAENLLDIWDKDVSISLKFYKNYWTNMSFFGTDIKMELEDGSKLKLTKFKMIGLIVYLPDNLDLSIDAKYSKVSLGFSVNGNLKVKGYDIDMTAENISKNLDIDMKYSKFKLLSAGNSTLKMYESKLRVKELKKVEANAKYSHYYVDNIQELLLTGYEDEINIKKVPKAKIIGKYCEIKIDNNQFLDVNLYEGGLISNTTEKAVVKAKYLEAQFGKIKSLYFTDGYENEYKIIEVDTLISVNGKYNEFEIGIMSSVLKVDGYEDDIEINKVSDSFDKIWIDGKYMDLGLNVSDKTPYKLYGNIQYPDFNIEKSDYKIVLHDKESSVLKFEYYKETDKAKAEIKLKGYEIELHINHL